MPLIAALLSHRLHILQNSVSITKINTIPHRTAAAINSVKRRILNCANRIIKQASGNLIALSFTFHAEEKITVPRVHRST